MAKREYDKIMGNTIDYSEHYREVKKAYYNYEKAEKDLHKAKVELWKEKKRYNEENRKELELVRKELKIAKGDYRKMLELREWMLKEIIDDSCGCFFYMN